MSAEQVILSAKDLDITFAGLTPFTAVSNISFEIKKGETLAIVGESGSGKSLTALALMGLLPKTATASGELILNTGSQRIHLNKQNLQPVRGSSLGMVFQEPMSALNPVMTVGKQIAEAILAHQKITRRAAREMTVEWLAKVQLPEPEKMYDRYPHQLSGGQKQRVMIAMAMCNHPSLLIADEPTTALDLTVQQEIKRLMQYLQQEHQTAMIFITHDLSLAVSIADQVLVLYKGKTMEYGSAEQVLQHPQNAYTQALLACKPSFAHKGYRLPVVADILGHNAMPGLQAYPQREVQPQQALLQVDDLRVWFAAHSDLLGRPDAFYKAVDGVSFTINKGEVMGLAGESGCGKSTLGRTLTGLIEAHSGEIWFDNKDLTKLSLKAWRPIRRQVQMIFQDPYSSLNPRMTIGDILIEPMAAYHIVGTRELRKEALLLLDLVQLPATAIDRYPHQFSGGQRQRIGIARALSLRPQLLICDESVSALDVSVQAQILNLLKDLQNEFQLTYLFISHDLSVVHYFSDRVMIMQAGKIVEQGDAKEVFSKPRHEYTKKLLSAILTE